MAIKVPTSLKSIDPFLRLAKEYEERDPVIAYFCQLHATKTGVKIDSDEDGKKFLLSLMDQVEKDKKTLKSAGNEAVASDVVAQAYVKNCAVNLFVWADTEDRKGVFDKNTIKSFYSASLLYDVLQEFGELTEEIALQRKYAKWKAPYLSKCRRRGETPIPGPAAAEEDDLAQMPPPAPIQDMPPTSQPPDAPSGGSSSPGGAQLQPKDYTEAHKCCQLASSALQNDDVPTAVDNLRKALMLLETGQE